jgi:CRISPR-associated protein Csd1
MSLLSSLVAAYDRNPDPPYGFSSERIGFCVVLNPDGSVAEVADLRDTDKKRSARIMQVPAAPKRSGSTPRPNFLWDNLNYALGAGKLTDARDLRFDAFRDKHLEFLGALPSEEVQALCRFLQSWTPESLPRHFVMEKPPTEGIVFAYAPTRRERFLHDAPELRAFWAKEGERWKAVEGKSAAESACLLTGRRAPVARTHPVIKGVWGAQVAGAAIISFNAEAYESYGHSQGDNAPVSEAAAFAYTTALNRFLAKDSGHRLQIGDTSTVFWADASNVEVAAEADLWAAVMLGRPDAQNEDERMAAERIREKLTAMRNGQPLVRIAPQLAEGVRFCVLGLAPNAARLSVRFFWEDSFGTLAANYAAWLRDVALEPAPDRPLFSIRAATLRAAPAEKRNGKSIFDAERVSPLLAGELTRAILGGGRFPRSLLGLLLLRIRSDHVLDRIRLSLIKGLILRDMRLEQRLPRHPDGTVMEDYLLRPDPQDPTPARRLGRLFALIERAQMAALGEAVNSGVTDKFLSAACATPQRVFPSLIQNAQHHIKRLRNGHSDADWIKKSPEPAKLARKMGDILDRDIGLAWAEVGDQAAAQHDAEEQGLFLVGYYQEKYARRAAAAADDLPEQDIDQED